MSTLNALIWTRNTNKFIQGNSRTWIIDRRRGFYEFDCEILTGSTKKKNVIAYELLVVV